MSSTIIRQSPGVPQEPPAAKRPGLLRQKIWLPRFAYEMVPVAWFLVAAISLTWCVRLGMLSAWSLAALITGLFSLAMAMRIGWARLRSRRAARH